MSQRTVLTPQMVRYDDFDDRGETRWLPFLMYFHRNDYRSDVINTDAKGFRLSHGAGDSASAGGRLPSGPVRLLVGSSTAFGIGVTRDAATIPSRLWTEYAPSAPWLNFAGRSFSSTQELLLFVLYRHLLPPQIDEIVVFSGLNDLAVARLPADQRGDHGAFFNCGEYFEQMEALRVRHRRQLKEPGGFGRRRGRTAVDEDVPLLPLGERISLATELTARHLASWRLLAPGARITFVLQPLATWIRAEPSPEEELLFAELDERSNFWELYGDIAVEETGRRYAEALRGACEELDVGFLDISSALAETVARRDWLFVDRAHFTDLGADIVARLLAERSGIS
jgi:hypothetical protein